ncbi:5'-methylthioadenosine/adenosylhomocysteine nucleosidase [Aquabacterium sp. A3]|uniref:5'-methylthioadenosine/adenosylhomocysteine nucleosidase n=1 Tax=Aquabacterium sp. A3 TaxID=3132829 RepID=UPI0031195E12
MNQSNRIGIMAAMPEELQALLDRMVDDTPVTLGGRTFWCGQLQGVEVVVVLSGIGKVAAAITTTLLLQAFEVNELWFTGVAGGLAPQVQVGDVVVADALVQHDMDASPLFARHELPGLGLSHLQAPAALIDEVVGVVAQAQPQPVHRGLVLSGDQFVASAGQVAELVQRLPGALAVEMEGAAVAQVCHAFDRPCVIVRTISDRADEAAPQDFGRFIAEVASPRSMAIVMALLSARSKR